MTTHIKVYPTKASALNAHHPIAGAPRVEGVDWPYDTFTCRRLTDGSFTEDPAKAYKPPPAEADAPAEKSGATSSTIVQGPDLGKSTTLPASAASAKSQESADARSK